MNIWIRNLFLLFVIEFGLPKGKIWASTFVLIDRAGSLITDDAHTGHIALVTKVGARGQGGHCCDKNWSNPTNSLNTNRR